LQAGRPIWRPFTTGGSKAKAFNNPVKDLAGGLPGEGERTDTIGCYLRVLAGQQLNVAMGQARGLARARRGQDGEVAQ